MAERAVGNLPVEVPALIASLPEILPALFRQYLYAPTNLVCIETLLDVHRHVGRDDEDTLFSDRYTFFYVYYRKEITSGKDELCDSVRLYSKSSFGSYKKEFLSACNRWDTVSLKTNKTLDWGDGDNVRRLAYRVIIKQGGQFSIQYVRIIPQVDSGEGEVIREYTVIIDE